MTTTLTAEELATRTSGIEKTLREEARFVDIATAVKDEVTVGYARMCLEAADMLKAQAAEIERLTRERDELRSLSPALYRSRAAAAEAKVAALTEILRSGVARGDKAAQRSGDTV